MPAFSPHPERATLLAEVHACPFHPLISPCDLLHFAFMTDPAAVVADQAALTGLCLSLTPNTTTPSSLAFRSGGNSIRNLRLTHGNCPRPVLATLRRECRRSHRLCPQGAKEVGLLTLDPTVATALSVPLALAAVAIVVRRIRKSHGGH